MLCICRPQEGEKFIWVQCRWQRPFTILWKLNEGLVAKDICLKARSHSSKNEWLYHLRLDTAFHTGSSVSTRRQYGKCTQLHKTNWQTEILRQLCLCVLAYLCVLRMSPLVLVYLMDLFQLKNLYRVGTIVKS